MTRRITLLFVFLLLCASSAWPKFSDDDKKYLDDQFRSILDQVQAMQNQIQTLNTQLQQLKENQTQFQAVIIRQQRAINEINQMVSSMSLTDDDHYSTLKAAIEKLRNDTQTAFNKLSPGLTQPGATVAEVPSRPGAPAPAAPRVTTGYIVTAEGNNLVVGLGSKDSMQVGMRLALYKGTDLSTHVGVLEVTQVIDADNCRVKIVTTNSGVKPEFGDSVRLEQ